MKTLSIITACLPSKANFLEETAESVNQLRALIDLEWILIFDGPSEIQVEEADQILRMPRHFGVAACRNAGLTVARGTYIHHLDADDVALPGLAEALDVLQQNPRLGWVAPNRILTTGETTPHWHEERDWEIGELAHNWSVPFPFHSNSLIMKKDLLLKIGGTPGLGMMEDTGVALRLSEEAPGKSLKTVVTGYRKWEGQTVAAAGYHETATLSYKFLEATINELRFTKGRTPVEAAVPAQKTLATVPLSDFSQSES